jgi:DNA-binding response OmpR family regulator
MRDFTESEKFERTKAHNDEFNATGKKTKATTGPSTATLAAAALAAANAAEAIELAMRQRFDFSILDFHLPNGTTGIEVFRRICAVRPLPAILMSGAANRDETAMAMQAGIFTFLRKPLDLERLRQSMHLLIQHHFGGPVGWPNPAPQPRPRPPQGPCR